MSAVQKINTFLSSAKLLHWTLPVLMIYLVAGTVAQKYIGLYQASNIFFAAPIIWIYDAIPIPGMPAICALIFINLTFKLVFKSPWTKSNAGIILTHIGAMLLLLGGLFTALFSSEGYIALGKGESTHIVSDYHHREFAVMDETGKTVALFDHKNLHADQTIKNANLPFTIDIQEYCVNCAINAREDASEEHQSMAIHMQLSPAPLKNNDEENMAGLTYRVHDENNAFVFVSIEDVPQYPRFTVGEKEYRFALRRQQRAMPFSIELIDFEKEVYPGTQMAKSYRSTVRIKDGDLQWESVISMNDPLRYKGYTFFQSSFSETPKGYVSVLAAVWNVGRAFPYISGIVMSIGLILHLFLRTSRSKKVLLPIIAAASLFSHQAYAQNAPDLDTDTFGQIPILHDGRMKPIDSFARALRKELSGTEKNALPWLIETLFDPARAQDRPAIKITTPEIISLLDLEKKESRLYGFQELSKALAPKKDLLASIMQAPQSDWTPQQRDLILLQDKLVTLQDLMGSLTPFLPLSVGLPETVEDIFKPYSARVLTFYEIRNIQDELQDTIKKIIAEKGDNIESYTPEEQALVQLSFTLTMLRDTSFASISFKIVPDGEEHKSPWAIINKNATSASFDILRDMAIAYHKNDASGWNDGAKGLYNAVKGEARENALKAEYTYNQHNPFYYSFLLCLFALAAMILSAYKWQEHITRWGVLPLLWVSFILQTVGIGTRMYILDRPPVSTLYETILFVSCVMTFYGLIAYLKQKRIIWLWLITILGVFLHILGFSHDQDGDSFVVLTAVLNTNFWLTTHVLCITAGYAFCAMTSVLAHYALILRARGQSITPDRAIFKNIHSTALIALFFAGIGTVLGGIWADQSWGRFWGWDPKENGALLIVLWLVWALHGRISGKMRMLGLLSAMAYLSVILALSWFGVNLLSVGLHAYGFTDSMAYKLGGFILIETLFVTCLYVLIKRREKHRA